MQRLTGTRPCHEQTKAAGSSHCYEQQHESVESGGCYPRRGTASGAPRGFDTDEHDEESTAYRDPAVEFCCDVATYPMNARC